MVAVGAGSPNRTRNLILFTMCVAMGKFK